MLVFLIKAGKTAWIEGWFHLAGAREDQRSLTPEVKIAALSLANSSRSLHFKGLGTAAGLG